MKSVMLNAAVIVAIQIAGIAPAPAARDTRGFALFEEQLIDLSEGWGEAQACVVWDGDHLVECFRTEAELVERVVTSARAEQAEPVGASSTCSSSLKLYDGPSYPGAALYLYQRTTWINLSDYGWANRTSSFKVGACLSYLADFVNGGGDWYPTSHTQAYDQSSSMISGWDNRVSSVYIG